MKMSILRGALGFAAVSLAAFLVWALGGRWLSAHLHEWGFYAIMAAIFLGLSGLALHPLVRGPDSTLRFTKAFFPAFLAYSGVWSGCWFSLGWVKGEWLGSLLGSVVFSALLGWSLGNLRPLARVALVVFVGHSAGYFLGGPIYYAVKGTWGALAWGLLYGLGFGAGIGYAFDAFQKEPNRPTPA
jgi:hypothetical protein